MVWNDLEESLCLSLSSFLGYCKGDFVGIIGSDPSVYVGGFCHKSRVQILVFASPTGYMMTSSLN